jgi:ABC-type amino acid transport substrate-binding protein
VFGAHRVGLRPDRSAAARLAIALLCAALLSACIFGPQTVNPTPTSTTTPSSGPTRPRFELSTYQYALQTKGKIRVALRDGALPMSTRRANGPYDGFEADIARQIAKAIWGAFDDPDTHIEWVSVDATTRIAALTSNQADVTLAGLAINDDNSKVIDLSDPYLHTGQRLLVKKTNDQIKELADVVAGDQTVCATKGSIWAENLKRVTNERAKILELDTMAFCVQALGTGAADAITSDELVLFGVTMSDPNLRVVGKPFTDDLLGIGLKKNATGDRQGFRDFLNLVLLTMVADRTWARLYEKDMTPVSGDMKQLPTD